MKVFISWSGEASQKIALQIFEWLPMVIQNVEPYLSSESIEKGARWASSLEEELEGTSVGIVILTPDNLNAPWIYFESGALAKVVGESRLAPLLFGLKPSDVGSPLSLFQVTQFNKEDVLKLLRTVNASCGDGALPSDRLEKMHDVLWTKLQMSVEPVVGGMKASVVTPKKAVSDNATSDVLEEILVLARQQAHQALSRDRLASEETVRMLARELDVMGRDRSPSRLRNIARFLERRWSELYPVLVELAAGAPNEDALRLLKRFEAIVIDLSEEAFPSRSRPFRDASGRWRDEGFQSDRSDSAARLAERAPGGEGAHPGSTE